MLERVARSRIDIDSARLVVLNAAIKIDNSNAKDALLEIAEAKILVPDNMLRVIDRAIQAFGGAGVSQETPLANAYAQGRTMRIVDGPDEVHLLQMGRNENKRGTAIRDKLQWQKERTDEIAKKYGIKELDPLTLNRTTSKAKL